MVFNNKLYNNKVNKDLNKWTNWKKEAYNEMFATSTHAKKIGYKNKK